MSTRRTVEQITADAILQHPQTVTVSGRSYAASPPSTATLIEASKYISQLPDFDGVTGEDGIYAAIAHAKDCAWLGEIAAILMLGKDCFIRENGMFRRNTDNVRLLADALLHELSAEDMYLLLVELFKMQKVGFFLSSIIFLKEARMIRKTKATASGQSSPES
jgi:hypothetical protein